MASNVVCGNCWVAYFDILGFERMLSDFDSKRSPNRLDLFVKNYYWDVVEALKQEATYCSQAISIAWSSDSFLLFSGDDSLKSFCHAASMAGDFFREAIGRMMPMRGAVGFGHFYADIANNIFLGPAFIDAYRYAEGQDWIGLIITPDAYKAHKQFHDNNLLSDRGFVKHEVIFNKRSGLEPKSLSVYRPDSSRDFVDHMLDKIRQMQSAARREHPDEYEQKYGDKYKRTIAFYRESPGTGVGTTWRSPR